MTRIAYVTTLVAALCLAQASVALAGARFAAPVSIDSGAREAQGSLGSARNSFGWTQYIGCWSRQIGNDIVGGCSARSGRTSVSCTFDGFNAQSFTWSLNAAGTDAHLHFTWDASGVCQTLKVTSDSRYEPKLP